MNINKLKDCLFFFIRQHSASIGRTKLVKLVYLADVLSYQKYGKTLTGLNYIFYDYGPWAVEFYSALESLPMVKENKGLTSFGDLKYHYEETGQPYTFTGLNQAEIAILEKIDQEWGGKRLREILRYVYNNLPLAASSQGEIIDFDVLEEEGLMLWESEAKSAVKKALDQAEWDVELGEVRISPEDDHGSQETAKSIEELIFILGEFAESGWNAYVPFDTGEAVFHCNGEDIAYSVLQSDYEEEIKKMGWEL